MKSLKKYHALAVVCFALLTAGCMPNYSEGERAGVITKISYKGIIWKSWEGSMNQGGMRTEYDDKGNASTVPNAFDFNVSDPAVIEKIKEASKTGERVELVYNQWLVTPPSIENGRVVVDVRSAR